MFSANDSISFFCIVDAPEKFYIKSAWSSALLFAVYFEFQGKANSMIVNEKQLAE